MKRVIFLFLAVVMMCWTPLLAHDFAVEIDDGLNTYNMYFNIISNNATDGYKVEVTYDGSHSGDKYSETVDIPDSVRYNDIYYHVTAIGEDAFLSQDSLLQVIIPKSVTSIVTFPYGAFDNCTALSTISVHSDNPVFDSRNSCNAIIETTTNTLLVGSIRTTIPSTVTKIGKCAFLGRGAGLPPMMGSFNEITIPDNVVEIEDEAFAGCELMTSISIGTGLATIGNSVFDYCPAMRTIEVNPLNPNFCVSDGALITKDSTEFVYVPATQKGVYRIPEGFTKITAGAFASSQIRFVSIPKTVTQIGYQIFAECTSLDTLLCRPLVPPVINNGYGSLGLTPSGNVLCVPYESLDAYKAIYGYTSAFAEIIGFSEVDEITETTATLKWRPDTAVVHYEIDILKGAVVVKHYDVDGSGHLIVPSPMPPICRMKKDTTTSSADYFVIKVSDLEAGTDYNYTIQGTNASHQSIYHEAGDFRTKSIPLDCNPLSADERRKARKVLQDGQMLIIRDERTYTVMGVEMK